MFYHSLESSTQCASNGSIFISLRHSVQVLPSDEKGHVYRNQSILASNFNFHDYFNFRSLYIKNCPSAKTDRRIAFCYFLESLAQCASNESNPIALRHSIQVLSSDESGHVNQNQAISASNFIFPNYFNFQSLYIKNCPSANTDHKIAFCYFLESLAQCASNKSNLITLRHSVQVLPSDETGHVYRNVFISASKPAIFIATTISKLMYKKLSLRKYCSYGSVLLRFGMLISMRF